MEGRGVRNGGRTALVLTGGGARAAYQAGVLLAISEILPDSRRNPFSILCGTSAGAINAATLACQAQNFRAAVYDLVDVWRNFHSHDVFRTDGLGVLATGVRWMGALSLGWLMRSNPRSLLDSSPLANLLRERLDFGRIDHSISSGDLYALSITASGYTSGHSVSFFQARAEVCNWQRAQRVGARVRLGVEHLLASSALPFIFPAVRIHREYFGDGSMRQLAPISPAIHLGAEKVLIIGSSRAQEPDVRLAQNEYPSLAQIAGHALSAIFLDTLTTDIERMERINRTLSRIPDEVRVEQGIPLRPIRSLVIQPSQRLDHLAARHARSLPLSVRLLLSGIGAMNRRGGALTSYLLFEQPYTRALVDLGYKDTLERHDEVRSFLDA
jgi:NTE family protein